MHKCTESHATGLPTYHFFLSPFSSFSWILAPHSPISQAPQCTRSSTYRRNHHGRWKKLYQKYPPCLGLCIGQCRTRSVSSSFSMSSCASVSLFAGLKFLVPVGPMVTGSRMWRQRSLLRVFVPSLLSLFSQFCEVGAASRSYWTVDGTHSDLF